MFVGHYGVALAAKGLEPQRSAGWAFLAVQFLDMLWAPAVLAGVEQVRIVPGLLPASAFDFQHMPWTHSLAMSLLWSLLFGAAFRSRVLGACVLSHWILDLAVHRPDLPLYPGGAAVGLGLWQWKGVTLAAEVVLLLAGLAVYWRATAGRPQVGRYAMAVYTALLAAIGAMNLYGPPPDAVKPVVVSALIAYPLLALAAAGLERLAGRTAKPATASS